MFQRATHDGEPLSSGEVHFLGSFIQGSIMLVETRRRLRLAWGMCQRHSLGALRVEAACRHGYLHGPAILYADLMGCAVRAFDAHGPLLRRQLARRLRERGPCLMCDLGYGPRSEGFVAPQMLAAGRDPNPLMRFLRATEPQWRTAVCGDCARNGALSRCRIHLREALRTGAALDLDAQRLLVTQVAERVQRFSDSFGWDKRGTDTAADRAALVSAAGWCGGWDALLTFAPREAACQISSQLGAGP